MKSWCGLAVVIPIVFSSSARAEPPSRGNAPEKATASVPKGAAAASGGAPANTQATSPSVQPEPKSSTVHGAPEDLVILKDGTRYRGYIVESVPGDHLLIRLASDLIRDVAAEDVVYAGPIAEAPGSAQPIVSTRSPTVGGSNPPSPAPTPVSPSPRAGEAWLHLQTSTPGLTVWASRLDSHEDPSEGAGYAQICAAPCSRPIELGSYRLAYSTSNGKLIKLANRINLSGEVTLKTDLESRRSTRALGWVILGIGAATGTILLSTAAVLPRGDERRKTDAALGAVGLAAGLAFGLPLGLSSDSPTVVVASGGGLPRRSEPRDSESARAGFTCVIWTQKF